LAIVAASGRRSVAETNQRWHSTCCLSRRADHRRALEIGDGRPEIMKGIIAREMFGREFMPYR